MPTYGERERERALPPSLGGGMSPKHQHRPPKLGQSLHIYNRERGREVNMGEEEKREKGGKSIAHFEVTKIQTVH